MPPYSPEYQAELNAKIKLDELKKQRSSAKSNMTRIKNYLNNNRDTITESNLECRIAIFEQFWRQWLSHQTAIEKLKPDDVTHETKRSSVEDLYCEVKSVQYGKIKSRNSIADENTSLLLSSITKNHHLPTIKLPTFSGKYSDYSNFIAMFNKLVGEDETLNTTEKYNHLRNCLTGPALKAIDALGKSAENYDLALNTLNKRYANKNLIFQEHISEFFDLAKITKESSKELRTLIDQASAHINAMTTIGNYDDILNSFIVYIVTSKLDFASQQKYEELFDQTKLPKWEDLFEILNKRCQLLEIRESKFNKNGCSKNVESKRKINNVQYAFTTSNNNSCSFCSETDHKIEKCKKFVELSVFDRFTKAKQLSLCINCLRPNHTVKQCKATTCKVCSNKHHSLLHRYETKNNSSQLQQKDRSFYGQLSSQSDMIPHTSDNCENNNLSSFLATKSIVEETQLSNKAIDSVVTLNKNKFDSSLIVNQTKLNESADSDMNAQHVILGTAIIQIQDSCGNFHLVRALLDSGSQINFVSQHLVQFLKLKRKSTFKQIAGIAKNTSVVKHEVNVQIKSRLNEYGKHLQCLILPSITNNHPEKPINKNSLQIPNNVELADPAFYKPQKIDLLIGADTFFELLCVGQIKLGNNGPILQKTLLGWIISGRYNSKSNSIHIEKPLILFAKSEDETHEIVKDDKSLFQLVEKFWEIENCDNNYSKLNNEHQNCENQFLDSICQLENKKLMVKLPFKNSVNKLGNSFNVVKQKFLALEKRLEKQPEIKKQYIQFLQEYEDLDHMEQISLSDVPSLNYFIPHQYVTRPESTSTKFRVVFNASFATSSSVSLNDILAVGPTVQNDIFSILIKFRCHAYAIIADVSKMYRQILVYPEDRNFQLILWRNHPQENIKIFRLKTLTYGTASAPYLATRCLNYLADKYTSKYEKSAQIIKTQIYVDDLITGGDSIEEIQKIKSEISEIFETADLELRKWYSNESSILKDIPENELEKPMKFEDSDVIRTLGIIWDPKLDEFRYKFNEISQTKNSKITKRIVLSDLSKLYDPLGLINPIIVTAKLFLQELWLLNLSWDESLPQVLNDQWENFMQSLKLITSIRISRCIAQIETIQTEIHGFSDASTKAYGACIYVRTINSDGKIYVQLLAAKSRIAPSKNKKKRTLPVMELLGAELLAKLWEKIKIKFNKQINRTCLWTDSTIALGWIMSHSSKWTTLVANRVSSIQEITEKVEWKHVNGKSNPADIISRGCNVNEIINNSFWFHGPEFLHKSEEFWPTQKFHYNEDLPERRKENHITLTTIKTDCAIRSTIYKYSNFQKTRRIFAYVCKFLGNLKNKVEKKQTNISPLLSVEDLFQGLTKIIYFIQREEFREEINQLENNIVINKSSSIKCLNPFIDANDGLLKVGGRLRNADLPYEKRCPILLPKNNNFINSYIVFLHFRHCHASSQTLISMINQQYWIINARNYTRKILRNCVHCFRYKPKLLQQIMGDLPSERVNAELAFSISGVDFCGPIYTSASIRGQRKYKTYIAVFICFVSKGVHLEIVTDLSADAFISALKRFISRRTFCRKLFCDNATNFVGARNYLNEFRQQFLNQNVQNEITNWCAENSITFKHIPPRSPHFGGIWEAAVKSAKTLLYPTIQNAQLNYEILSTVCCQIESIINSRPITPMSTDPNDERALTPAHFWGQAPLESLIEPNITNLKYSYLSKWQRISAIQQHFWQRWSKEYLLLLQKRIKWNEQQENLTIGKLVLIHEDNLPPQKWLLGRILKCIAGKDNKIRVVDVKTKCGILRRSIQKLALLPIDIN